MFKKMFNGIRSLVGGILVVIGYFCSLPVLGTLLLDPGFFGSLFGDPTILIAWIVACVLITLGMKIRGSAKRASSNLIVKIVAFIFAPIVYLFRGIIALGKTVLFHMGFTKLGTPKQQAHEREAQFVKSVASSVAGSFSEEAGKITGYYGSRSVVCRFIYPELNGYTVLFKVYTTYWIYGNEDGSERDFKADYDSFKARALIKAFQNEIKQRCAKEGVDISPYWDCRVQVHPMSIERGREGDGPF